MRAAIIIALVATLAAALPTNAQESVAIHRSYTTQRISEPPRIDGKGDDDVWLSVPTTLDFTQFKPDPGKPSRNHTEVKIAYNDQALYVLARMNDTAQVSTV